MVSTSHKFFESRHFSIAMEIMIRLWFYDEIWAIVEAFYWKSWSRRFKLLIFLEMKDVLVNWARNSSNLLPFKKICKKKMVHRHFFLKKLHNCSKSRKLQTIFLHLLFQWKAKKRINVSCVVSNLAPRSLLFKALILLKSIFTWTICVVCAKAHKRFQVADDVALEFCEMLEVYLNKNCIVEWN